MDIDEAMRLCCMVTNMQTVPKRLRVATSLVLQELGFMRRHVKVERPRRHYGIYYCPECSKDVSPEVDALVCSRCGKKLDWSN